MLIGLFGGSYYLSYTNEPVADLPKDICAGKHEIADYLVAFEGFTLIKMPSDSVPEQDILSCVTKDFQKRWVTVINGCYEYVSKALLGRPFFLLVYVDAPLLMRWARYKNRYTQGF
jgi:dCMP deaminase